MTELFQPKLMLRMLRDLRAVNLGACLLVGIYLLVRVKPLLSVELLMMLGIFLHSILVSRRLIRFSTGYLQELRTEPGKHPAFRCDQVWFQLWLAALASAAMVSLSTWLLIVMRIRSLVQHQFFNNPWFPLAASWEATMPLIWLAIYGVVMPLVIYGLVRSRLPDKQSANGWMLMVLGLGALPLFSVAASIGPVETKPLWLNGPQVIMICLFFPTSISLICASRRLFKFQVVWE